MSYVKTGFPEIRAIFLAQFHPDLGPIVRLSVPDDAVDTGPKPGSEPGTARSTVNLCELGDEARRGAGELVQLVARPGESRAPAAATATDGDKIDFNSIQALVIPKLTLFERLITVNTGRHKVMCYPVSVEGNYVRNVFIFNMCFAFDIAADTKCFGPVVKRVGCLLKELEITGRLLSDPDGSRPLRTMMRQLVAKLNAHGEYQIELDLKGLLQPIASTGFSIKLFPYYGCPRTIRAYHVPVKVADFDVARSMSAQTAYRASAPDDVMWDLVLERVIQFIDGVNHVHRISRLALIREETTVLALRHLDYYGCIVLVDIFQFGNVYEAGHRVMALFRDGRLQRECLAYVAGDRAEGAVVPLDRLLALYATVRRRWTVAEWIVENGVDVEQLDVRRFFVFGVVHGLLRRVYCHPVLRGAPPSLAGAPPSLAGMPPSPGASDAEAEAEAGSAEPPGPGAADALGPRLLARLDGTHNLDEISIAEDKDCATLRDMFARHGGIEYVHL
ncbi:Nitrogen permease regulator 2 [Coemansia javaensis]|uniref:Nitrogen permease regulator 2 n=1 Tax=Coemansia javaensis TaxID=2761396 RepID=A0A9W8HIB4_9FUNG|nr:Nitrogen permease regulator 2 [Coemansia javaensis]